MLEEEIIKKFLYYISHNFSTSEKAPISSSSLLFCSRAASTKTWKMASGHFKDFIHGFTL